MKKTCLALIVTGCLIQSLAFSQTVRDDVLRPGLAHFDGFLGDRINGCVEKRLMSQDLEKLLFAFRDKSDGKWGFRTEFWGKWYTAAMMGYDYSPTPAHKAVVDAAVRGLIATQGADGYIGTYPDEYHLGDWDIWGRKYTILGLLAYYDRTKDATVLEAARKSAQDVRPEHERRAADKPHHGADTEVHQVLHDNVEALSDKPMWKMSGAPKAYEMMSCFEGLVELYRCTGNEEYKKAVLNLVRKIERDELMIVGTGSVAEIWCHGKLHQSEPIYQGMETCVTVTWMKLVYQLLRLTGDSHYADLLEQSLYNAMLASMTPDGKWFSYYSGLMGERVYSHQQFPDVGMSCCVANGPRGLMTVPFWAVMSSEEGPVINLYSASQTSIPTPAAQNVKISVTGSYPEGNTAAISLDMDKEETFTLKLRIPDWSLKTEVMVNGKAAGKAKAGKYLKIKRKWHPGDQVVLSFDFTAKVLDAPNGTGDAAIRRGPIVLSFDTRLIPRRDGVDTPPMYRYEFDRQKDGSVDVRHIQSPDPALWMTFEVACKDESGATHYLNLCDYASAGNSWKEGNLFRVWTPQPFDYRHLYINNLDWHVNCTVGVKRPELP